MANRSKFEDAHPTDPTSQTESLEILLHCQTVLAHTEDMNYIFGLDGRFIYLNQALLTLWGKTFDEAIGLNFAELDYPEDLAHRLNGQIQEVISTGQTVKDETGYTSVIGKRFYEYIFIPVFASDGSVEAVAGSTRDVTDRVEAVQAHQRLLRVLDAERNRLNDIFHQAPAFFCVLSGPEHVCEMANDRFRQITGNRELIGMKIRDAFPDLVGQGFFEILDQVYQTGSTFTGHDMPVLFQHSAENSPEARTVELVYQPLRDADGSVIGVLAQGIDLTLRKRAEEELRASEERHRLLAVELAQADRRKDEFLALLAHELRNPLAPLRNAAAILQSGQIPEQKRDQVHGVIVRQVENMSRMLDDLLDVSRITSGKIDLRTHPVDMRTMIHAAASALQSTCARLEVELTVQVPDDPILVEIDDTRMEQVLCNLIGNACKYSGLGKHVHVSAERMTDELGNEEVIIHVIDDGIGIDLKVLPHVFDLFVQDSRALDRSEGGLGIGLTIVQRLVALHGGTISAHSEGPGHGTTFTIRLPMLNSTSSTPESVEPLTDPSQPSLRILIVDDNRDSAETMAMLQELRGHETRVAYDGLSALAAAAEFNPAVMLLDIGLPELNGYEVASRIRANPQHQGILLIALTGYGSEEDRERTKQAGFHHHLVKPMNMDLLNTLLDQHFSRDHPIEKP